MLAPDLLDEAGVLREPGLLVRIATPREVVRIGLVEPGQIGRERDEPLDDRRRVPLMRVAADLHSDELPDVEHVAL